MGALTEAFDFVKRWVTVALIVASVLACLKMAQLEAELAEAKLSAATERTDREIAARLHEANLAKREQTHATKQQEKEDDYSAEKLALEKRVAAERAASNSLRTQLASATARANAGSATDPVACERAFNRLEELGGLAGYRSVLFPFRRIPGHSQFVIRCNLRPDPINAPGRSAHDTRRVDRLPQESIAQGRHDNCLACDRS